MAGRAPVSQAVVPQSVDRCPDRAPISADQSGSMHGGGQLQQQHSLTGWLAFRPRPAVIDFDRVSLMPASASNGRSATFRLMSPSNLGEMDEASGTLAWQD